MNNLTIFLLGRPQFFIDGTEVTGFNTRKDCALLIYLATTGTAHSRETLAGLLWSELPEENARRNLRHTLSHLQKVIGPQWITTERGVALTQEQPWSVDVQTLRTAVKSLTASPQLGSRRTDAQVMGALDQALNLYRGEFLQGFYIQQAVHFEEWVLAQREESHLLTLRGLEVLVEHCLGQGAYEQGLTATRSLLQLEPWSEPAHCLQMQLLAQSGRRADALTQYERCRQILDAELGVEPLPTTTALYRQIQAGQYNQPVAPSQPVLPVSPALTPALIKPTAPAKPVVPHNLFVPLAEFVGRQTELAFIRQRLAAADCRLLTIVGPGGMGKTSLALALGQQLLHTQQTDFPDGIFFVSLADISTTKPDDFDPALMDDPAAGEAILRAIAEQLGYKLEVGVSSAVQLQTYLRVRRLLLILDNFEHLLAGTDAVLALLTQAPLLKALITSRARLNLRGETVLTLHPLSLPTAPYLVAVEAAQANPAHTIQKEVWQASEAVVMFVQRAQQVDPTFAINVETIGPVSQICQLVEGLPLGIELATSMLPLVSCTALAAALARSLDVLAAETRDLPSAQRTLGAVFERSWHLLPPAGQQLLAKLSIFPGSFGRDAAEHIAGASNLLLRRLLDQSLLSKVGDDRFAMHRTVQAFAEQKLHQWPAVIETLQVQYVHFYLAFLARLEQGLTGEAYARSVEQIQMDLDNVHTTWRWAVTHHLYEALNRCLLTIYWFYEQQGFYLDSIALYEYALVHLRPSYEKPENEAKPSPALTLLIGRLQTHFGWCNLRLGRFPQALAAYESGWTILQVEVSPIASAVCLGFWGMSTRGLNPQRSVELLAEALRLAQTSGGVWLQAIIGQCLGETIFLLGDYTAAETHITAGYVLAKQINWPRGLTSGAKSLGRVNLARGLYPQAEEHLRASIEFARQHHFKILGLEGMIALGEALRFQGRRAEASACFAESRQLALALGSGEFVAPILWEEGCLAEQNGEYGAAKALFTESLAIGLPNWWGHALPTLGWALIGLGELDAAQAYFQKVWTAAEAKARLPICLDAQAGLAYIQAIRARQASQILAAQWRRILDEIYHQPAATAETHQRIDKIRLEFELSPDPLAFPISTVH